MIPLVEKGLPSAKATTKQNSLEALMLYVELDKAEPILDDILVGLTNKQPKIISSTLIALTALYHAYGVKIVDPKPTLKALPKLFSHADKNVRAEATKLTVEMYRWLRTGMKKLIWDELKPVQQQDLEKLFAAVDAEPAPKQERLLQTQQEEAEAAAAVSQEHEQEAGEDEAEEEAETLDLAEPKDVLSKLPPGFYDSMASAKWKDRKDALDAAFAEINTEKIIDGHFDELVAVLAKAMKDANIAVVTTAANVIDALARGLRKRFARYRGRVMPPIMERLKEKKQSVTDALGQALDTIFASSSLTDCLEDILTFLKHKNPNVKAETLKFLIRCLRTTKESPLKPEAKSIADAATKLLSDSVEATRSGGAEVLGTLMKIIGERAMNPYMEGLDDIRKTKIKEYCDKAVVKAKVKPKPAAAPPPPPPPPKTPKGPVSSIAATKKVPAGAGPGLKLPTKRPSSPQVEKPTSPPSKAASKAASSKVGGLQRPGSLVAPSAGLKKKLPGAGPSPAVSSPRRTITPHSEEEGAPAPKLGRGLVGRPLGKPMLPATSEPAAVPSSTGLSSAERGELEELRTDRDRLQRIIDDLKADKSRLTAQIHELQNHNAELIEDHTRDVLSIKAKETQLVRARSDADAAENSAQRLHRENERLKRELSRSIRQGSPSAGGEDQIFRDSASSSGAANGTLAQRPTYEGHRSSRYLGSPSSEKENGSYDGIREASSEKPTLSRQTTGSRPESMGYGDERAMPDWKRAGEVTSQLKARIEAMKVRLLFGRLDLTISNTSSRPSKAPHGSDEFAEQLGLSLLIDVRYSDDLKPNRSESGT